MYDILSNKCRISRHRPLDASIEFARYIVKANLPNHVGIRDGNRVTEEHLLGHPYISSLTGCTIGRATRVADNVRAKFVNYFNNEV